MRLFARPDLVVALRGGWEDNAAGLSGTAQERLAEIWVFAFPTGMPELPEMPVAEGPCRHLQTKSQPEQSRSCKRRCDQTRDWKAFGKRNKIGTL